MKKMLTSSVICDAISFFGARRKPSYHLNDLKNFNEFFRKDEAQNNVKSHKKAGFHPLFGKHIATGLR